MIQTLLKISDLIRHKARVRRWDPDLASGRRGEDLAHRFLQQKGYVTVARNYRLRSGLAEVDIIAWHGETLVFVEVKSRAPGFIDPPERAVDEEKQRRIVRAAGDYVKRVGVGWDRVRFDIVGVVFTNPPTITHFPDAFGK